MYLEWMNEGMGHDRQVLPPNGLMQRTAIVITELMVRAFGISHIQIVLTFRLFLLQHSMSYSRIFKPGFSIL